MTIKLSIQYACAVLLILSSIALAFLSFFEIQNINDGILIYIAQALLFAASVFGMSYYVEKISKYIKQFNGGQPRPKKQ